MSSKGKMNGVVGKGRIGCYGGSDTPTKATPRPPAKVDAATKKVTSGTVGVRGAGRNMGG